MFARRAHRVSLHVGNADVARSTGEGTPTNCVACAKPCVRWTRREPRAVPPQPETIATAPDPGFVRAGVETMRLLGTTGDGKQIRVGTLAADAPLLREIGRLRELTFRAVGEGHRRGLDLDAWDSWYEHIVLWDDGHRRSPAPTASPAALGAGRAACAARTPPRCSITAKARSRIAQGMELGRSFIAPEYWGSRGIDYLW